MLVVVNVLCEQFSIDILFNITQLIVQIKIPFSQVGRQPPWDLQHCIRVNYRKNKTPILVLNQIERLLRGKGEASQFKSERKCAF